MVKVVFIGSSCNKRDHPTWGTSKGVLEGLVTGLELVLGFWVSGKVLNWMLSETGAIL